LNELSITKPKKNETALLQQLIIDSVDDKKAEGITLIDLTNITEAISDYFIICEANNKPQIRAIAEHLMHRVKTEMGELPLHKEGMQNFEWVLIDYFDVVVHIFETEKRQFYNMEELWSDGIITNY